MKHPFPCRDLSRLARRVLAGEVVFFIGAGFSLDSEGNSAWRLIGRLLARFEAMTGRLQDASVRKDIRERSRELRAVLRQVFALKEGLSESEDRLLTQGNLKALSSQYYNFNDWITSAFTALLNDIDLIADHGGLEEDIHQEENRLLQHVPDSVDLDELQLHKLLKIEKGSRGKVLFLDTMGFANEKIMKGPHLADDLKIGPGSGTECLRDRHHVLARLAREGLCPTLLTTNYDLLVEWAFRLSGLKPQQGNDPRRLLPPVSYQNLVRIADATDFFGQGDDHRSAVIVKIHGCVDRYRLRRPDPEALPRFLRSMVFTYREIQNWREDSWSRDFLRTLLRTRTLVFCGYSGIDPVIHDTFRTVYEEMAERRRPLVQKEPESPKAPKPKQRRGPWLAPAYFFGLVDTTEFHGMEILRAASRAIGEQFPGLTNHPNYLRFHKVKTDEEQGKGEEECFPTLDELMLWLFHLTFRRSQWQALGSDLRRIAGLLLRHPCPESEIRAVQHNFARLYGKEVRASRGWDEGPERRFQFERIAGWTDRFQVSLLREMATAEAVLRNQGPGVDFEDLRRWPWYFPALERTDWTAWAAVVELAVRRMVAVWRRERKTTAWAEDSQWVRPGTGRHPAVFFSRGEGAPTPVELTIHLASFARIGEVPETHGAFRHRVVWELQPHSVPWNVEKMGRTPSAKDIWRWATRTDLARIAPGHEKNLSFWLGEQDEQQRSTA